MNLYSNFPFKNNAACQQLRCICVILATFSMATLAPATIAFTNMQFLVGSTANTEVLDSTPYSNLVLTATAKSFDIMSDTLDPVMKRNQTGGPPPADLADLSLARVAFSGTSALRLNPVGAAYPAGPSSNDPSRIRSDQSHQSPVSFNNPGNLSFNTLRLTFSSHLTVTDAAFTFTSLNTSGVSWEYSVLRFFDASGNYFSPISGPAWTVGAPGQYLTALATSGFNGQAGIGNFVAASTGTVTQVGTNQAVSGSNGPSDNLIFNYTVAGLSPGTVIGGIEWSTYLENVRGVNNTASNFTSSLTQFSISGKIPEPASGALALLGVVIVSSRRRR